MVSVLLNPEKLDWSSADSFLFLNPRFPSELQTQYFDLALKSLGHLKLKNEPDHGYIILASSGTTAQVGDLSLKLIRKENFLKAAENFNLFFGLSHKDYWLKNLPRFHVGGLAILARAYLSGSPVFELPELAWNVESFYQCLKSEDITRVSLVPTQVYDLVKAQIQAPSRLRSVFVGGATLDEELYMQARQLGWALLPSYGMTETSSMVMSADEESLKTMSEFPSLKKLPGIQLRLDSENRLHLKAPGLLTLEAQKKGGDFIFHLFQSGVEFQTQDYFVFHNGKYQFEGRSQDLIKVSGELVNLQKLRQQWSDFLRKQNDTINPYLFFVFSQKHERKGDQVVLYFEVGKSEEKVGDLVDQFNQTVLPYERIMNAIKVEKIPRTDLGKVKIDELRKLS